MSKDTKPQPQSLESVIITPETVVSGYRIKKRFQLLMVRKTVLYAEMAFEELESGLRKATKDVGGNAVIGVRISHESLKTSTDVYLTGLAVELVPSR